MKSLPPIVGTWFAHRLRYAFPGDAPALAPSASAEDIASYENVGRHESAWRTEHENAQLHFMEDGTWVLDANDDSIDTKGHFTLEGGRLVLDDPQPGDGYVAIASAQREGERVVLALEMTPDSYDMEPIQAIVFERQRPLWRERELTLIERLILRPEEADDLLSEADTDVVDVAPALWGAFVDGRLRPPANTWTYAATTDLLTWDGVCEKGIDDDAAAAIVKHVDPIEEYSFACHLVAFVQKALDRGAPLVLNDGWRELLASSAS